MAVRSLSDVFILMRNNALQSKSMFGEQSNHYEDNDRTRLVQRIDPEHHTVTFRNTASTEWIENSQEINYDISRIRDKMQELTLLHDKHLNRPTLDDNVDEEHIIEILTQEITQLFHGCNNNIKLMGSKIKKASSYEKTILKNAVSSVVATLQEVSTDFRKSQSTYLKKLKAREDRSHQFFNCPSALMIEDTGDLDEEFERGFSQGQVAIINQNSVNIDQRDEEILNVVKSISDLASIFQDIGNIIVEQGTLLDRIDYNVEQSVVKTESGLVQLQKAEHYQKKNKKLMIIFIMAIITTVLLILLVAIKS